jgi:hypothetical protein
LWSVKGVESRIVILVLISIGLAGSVFATSGPVVFKNCTDSDGVNPFTKGTTTYTYTNLGIFPKMDSCAGNNVSEYICPNQDSDVALDAVSASVVANTPSASVVANTVADPGTTTDPVVNLPGPDIKLFPSRIIPCAYGCADGKCSNESPAISLDAKTSWATPDDLRVHCYSSSISSIKYTNITTYGYDFYGRLQLTITENIDCSYPSCDASKVYSATQRKIALPGMYIIYCEATDGTNKKKNTTITFNSTCTVACPDAQPPYIQNLAMTASRTNFVWLDLNATDYTSGMKNMSLLVYYKPTGQTAYQVYSNETKQCSSAGCLYYKVLKGTGAWIANATVYDNAGNKDQKEARITI